MTGINRLEKKHHLAGYLADWGNWDGNNMDVRKLTRLNYAFALVSENRVHCDSLKKVHWIKIFKQINPNLETFLSIGGWGADGFSDAALTNESRNCFAETALSLLTQYGFDGIDVDWEYPCRDYANIKARPEDRSNFTLLLKTLREKLNALEDKNCQSHPLTIAAGAAKLFADDMELDKITPLLDTINLMTYDFHTVGPKPGHHTNLYTSVYDKGSSADKSVEVYLNSGVPADKIVLGAAFYGRSWSGLDPSNQPIGQNGQVGKSYSYAALKDTIIDKGQFKRYWDDTAKAPYLSDGSNFITYDDTESLTHKVKYVKEKGLAGIMFWEWSEDKEDELLNTLTELTTTS